MATSMTSSRLRSRQSVTVSSTQSITRSTTASWSSKEASRKWRRWRDWRRLRVRSEDRLSWLPKWRRSRICKRKWKLVWNLSKLLMMIVSWKSRCISQLARIRFLSKTFFLACLRGSRTSHMREELYKTVWLAIWLRTSLVRLSKQILSTTACWWQRVQRAKRNLTRSGDKIW